MPRTRGRGRSKHNEAPIEPMLLPRPDHLPDNFDSMGVMDKIVFLLKKEKNKKAKDACPACRKKARAAQEVGMDVDEQCAPNIPMRPEDVVQAPQGTAGGSAEQPETADVTKTDSSTESEAEEIVTSSADVRDFSPSDESEYFPADERDDTPADEGDDNPADEGDDNPADESDDSNAVENDDSPADESDDTPADGSDDSYAVENDDSPADESDDSPADENDDSPADKSDDSDAYSPASLRHSSFMNFRAIEYYISHKYSHLEENKENIAGPSKKASKKTPKKASKKAPKKTNRDRKIGELSPR